MKHKDIKKRWTIVINTVQLLGLKLTFIYIADSSLNVYLPNMLHQLLPKKYNIQRINQTSWDRDSVNKGEKKHPKQNSSFRYLFRYSYLFFVFVTKIWKCSL